MLNLFQHPTARYPTCIVRYTKFTGSSLRSPKESYGQNDKDYYVYDKFNIMAKSKAGKGLQENRAGPKDSYGGV